MCIEVLDASLEQARGRDAESWRSARSLDNIRQNLLGCQALFRTALAPQLNDSGLKQALDEGFERSVDAVDAIPGQLATAVADPAARASVNALRRRVTELAELFADTVPAAIDRDSAPWGGG